MLFLSTEQAGLITEIHDGRPEIECPGSSEPRQARNRALDNAQKAKSSRSAVRHQNGQDPPNAPTPRRTLLAEPTKAVKWQAHSVRGFFSGAVRGMLCLKVKATKRGDGTRVYRAPGWICH
jgi:hypothetical protein